MKVPSSEMMWANHNVELCVFDAISNKFFHTNRGTFRDSRIKKLTKPLYKSTFHNTFRIVKEDLIEGKVSGELPVETALNCLVDSQET